MTHAGNTERTSDAPLMLSVSGCRGIVGRSLTPAVVARFADALAHRGWQQLGSKARTKPRIVIGGDGRAGGEAISRIASGSLMAAGCDVIDCGVATTPTIGMMVEHHGAQGGLVLTASHNPAEWNGMKPITAEGNAPAKHEAEALIARYHDSEAASAWVESDRIGAWTAADAPSEFHVERVLAQVGSVCDLDAIRERRFRVVLNSVNASGALPGRMLLEDLGCDVTHLHSDASGVFPHTPEPTEANLRSMSEFMATMDSEIGFAQDPDADRLAILDGHGRYIGEEYTLVLSARAVLETMMKPVSRPLATNLSTSRMIDDLAEEYGTRVVRSAVGEANLVQAMREQDVLIGGEGNGGVIWPATGWIRDSLVAMGLTLALLTRTGLSLDRLINDKPRYAIVKRKTPIREGLAEAALAAVKAALPGASFNDADGVRADLTLDGGGAAWVHVRPSNTEPILRLIAEAPTADAANDLLDQVEGAIG